MRADVASCATVSASIKSCACVRHCAPSTVVLVVSGNPCVNTVQVQVQEHVGVRQRLPAPHSDLVRTMPVVVAEVLLDAA